MFVKSDKIVNVSFERNYQSSNFFQTMMNMETKSFLLQIPLSDMNKSQLFFGYPFSQQSNMTVG